MLFFCFIQVIFFGTFAIATLQEGIIITLQEAIIWFHRNSMNHLKLVHADAYMFDTCAVVAVTEKAVSV